ncbi:sulfite exporter TauE/SafE family protein [Rhodococcus sp. SBT000017]|uniref:sulfite exporter TauE/SafE family protein n=1 Tax=Rhodococcus sp. SBT000017 TaxID=1803385 RepID=UPI00217EF33E|nr:sulfite exporter TauE/SafE family protein [Rhodococcus sp. SBT000017]
MVATLAIAVAAGILIGLSLGALGGGGSILTVPALVYLLAVEPQSATSASLIIVGITSIIAAISHARARHVRWRAAAVFGILGSVTAFGGSILNRSVDPQILLLAFAALMIVAAGAMLRRTRRGHDADLPTPNPAETAGTRPSAVAVATKPAKVKITASQVVKLVASALVVGFLTGFLGVGGGFLIVPALVLALGYSMPVAVGTSLVIISITSAGPSPNASARVPPSRGRLSYRSPSRQLQARSQEKPSATKSLPPHSPVPSQPCYSSWPSTSPSRPP